jgi:hypothetical protein
LTIREYIVRRGKWVNGVTLLWFVVTLLFFFVPHPSLSTNVYRVRLLAAVVPLVTLKFAIAWRTRCPRCGGGLSALVRSTASPKTDIDHVCPHCGVSIEEPMECTAPGA